MCRYPGGEGLYKSLVHQHARTARVKTSARFCSLYLTFPYAFSCVKRAFCASDQYVENKALRIVSV